MKRLQEGLRVAQERGLLPVLDDAHPGPIEVMNPSRMVVLSVPFSWIPPTLISAYWIWSSSSGAFPERKARSADYPSYPCPLVVAGRAQSSRPTL